MSKKFSKSEIKKLMKDVPKKVIIHEETEYEKFKQIKLDGEYAPYFISSCGRLFSINKNSNQINNPIRELKTRLRNDGYYDISITYNSKKHMLLIHVLVASAFVKNEKPKKYKVVNHLDGDKGNNLYLNLEWTTYSGNTIHALKTGLFKHAKGEQVGGSKYTEDEIIKVCELLEQNISIKDISNKLGMNYSSIANLLYKREWFHVVCNFDFSNYKYGKSEEDIENMNRKIHKLCTLASSGNYTIKQLSEIIDINRRTVYDILKGRTHKPITKQYDLSKYQN